MGGCLWFHSEERQGTMFKFAIPRDLMDENETDSDYYDEITTLTTQSLSNHILDNIKEDYQEIISELYDIEEEEVLEPGNFNTQS